MGQKIKVPKEHSGGWWKIRDSFVKEVTFELCLEYGEVFHRQQKLRAGPLQPEQGAAAEILRGVQSTVGFGGAQGRPMWPERRMQ